MDRMEKRRLKSRWWYCVRFLVGVILFTASLVASYSWSFSFIVCGDSRSNNHPAPVAEKYGILINKINASGVKFVVHTGDFYIGAPSRDEAMRQANIFTLINRTLTIPFYPVMGNHEAQGEGWAVCKEVLFNGATTYYSFSYENSYFIILDAHQPKNEYKFSEEQAQWLTEKIKEYRKGKYKHLFVFAHPPIFPLSHVGNSLDKYSDVQDWLCKTLSTAGADVYFCGHDHLYSRMYYKGVFQVISGGAGAPLYKPREKEALEYSWERVKYFKVEAVEHWVKVSVTDDKVECVVYDLADRIIDEFSIVKKKEGIEVILEEDRKK